MISARRPIPACIDEFSIYVGGEVPVTEYGQSGTQDVGDNAVGCLANRGAALLANHGMVAVGPTPALFERELLLICSARSGSRSVTPSGGFHLSRVDAIGHVVSRQTRTSRAGTEVSSAVEQSLDGGRMFLFHGPHQSRRTAQVFFRVHVRSGRKQNPYRFRVAVARRKHDHRFPVASTLFRIRTSLEEFLDHRGVTVETSHGQRSNPLTIRHVHLFAGAN